LVTLAALGGCEEIAQPCRFSWASIEMPSRERADVRFGVRDANGRAVTVEGTLDLVMHERAAGDDAESGRVLCRASADVPAARYAGDPAEATVALTFSPACERAAAGAAAAATLELRDRGGHVVRWAGLGGPFTAWLRAEPAAQ
jgi:hypothetical protein